MIKIISTFTLDEGSTKGDNFHIKLNLETHDVDLSTDILLEVC